MDGILVADGRTTDWDGHAADIQNQWDQVDLDTVLLHMHHGGVRIVYQRCLWDITTLWGPGGGDRVRNTCDVDALSEELPVKGQGGSPC